MNIARCMKINGTLDGGRSSDVRSFTVSLSNGARRPRLGPMPSILMDWSRGEQPCSGALTGVPGRNGSLFLM
jgi:hypothetical protein